ncbi:uncharacterized protein MONBRDRAFT_25735, partial [Monosiga brevicollis MX1]
MARNILNPLSKSAGWLRRRFRASGAEADGDGNGGSSLDASLSGHSLLHMREDQAADLDAAWYSYLEARATDESVAAECFDAYVYCVMSYLSDRDEHASLQLDAYPDAFCHELGLQLGAAVAQVAPLLREPGFSDEGSGLIKHTAALLRLSALVARDDANLDALTESDVTSHITALALAIVARECADSAIKGMTILELLDSYALPFVQRVFAPGQAWIQTPALSGAALEHDLAPELRLLDQGLHTCYESLRSEAVLAASLASPGSPSQASGALDFDPASGNGTSDTIGPAPAPGDPRLQMERIFCVLNAWTRCSGERAQLVTMHQRLRSKILRLARAVPAVPWLDELLVVMLACIPQAAENSQREEYFAAQALVCGLLGQCSTPFEDTALAPALQTAYLQRTAQLLRVIRRSLRSPRPHTLHRLLLENQAFASCLAVLERAVDTELLTAAFRTIAAMIHQEGGEQWFRTRIGYQRLFDDYRQGLRLGRFHCYLWLELVIGLSLNWDSPAINETLATEPLVIRAPAALAIFLEHLPQLDLPSTTVCPVLQGIMHMIQDSYHNANCCCEGNVTAIILTLLEQWHTAPDDVSDHLVRLLELLVSHAVETAELRRLLNLLFVQSPTFRPELYLRLQALLRVAAAGHEPMYLMDLHGTRSMLWVPHLDASLGGGYTFHTWIRIESLDAELLPIDLHHQHGAPVRVRPSRSTATRVTAASSEHAPAEEPGTTGLGSSSASEPDPGIGSVRRESRQMGSYEPRLFSFHAAGGSGFEAFFTAGRLAVRTVVGQGNRQQMHTHVFSTTQIPIRRWISLAVVQTNPAHLFGGKGETKLFLDGELRETAALPCPSRRDTYLDCRIGRGRDADESIALNPMRTGNTSLRAQLANIHIFEPLTTDQIRAVYALGIDYVGSFDACTLASFKQNHTLDQVVQGYSDGDPSLTEVFFDAAPPDALSLNTTPAVGAPGEDKGVQNMRKAGSTDLVAARTLIEQPIQGLLKVMYPAQLCRNGQIRNQATMIDALAEEQPPAVLTGTLCVRRSVRQVIGTLGGVQVICFLLAQLDDVVEAVYAYNMHTAGKSETVGELGSACVAAFFDLLQGVLRDDVNVAQVLQGRVLAVISALLQRSEYAVLGIQDLMSIQALLERASPKAEFVRAVCKQLVFDFELWGRSDYAVRVGHVRTVAELIRNHPTFFRQHYGVQYVIDLLRPSLRESQERARARLGSVSVATRSPSDTSSDEESSVYACVMGLLEMYLRRSVSQREAKALLRFVLAGEDLQHTLLVLNFCYNALLSVFFCLLTHLDRSSSTTLLGQIPLGGLSYTRSQLRLLDIGPLSLLSLWGTREPRNATSYEVLKGILDQAVCPRVAVTEAESGDGFTLLSSEFDAGSEVPLFRCELVAPDFVTVALRLLDKLDRTNYAYHCRILLDLHDLLNAEGVAHQASACVFDWMLTLTQWLTAAAFNPRPLLVSNLSHSDQSRLGLLCAAPEDADELTSELSPPLAAGLHVLAQMMLLQMDTHFEWERNLRPVLLQLLPSEGSTSKSAHSTPDLASFLTSVLLRQLADRVYGHLHAQSNIGTVLATNVLSVVFQAETHYFHTSQQLRATLSPVGRHFLLRAMSFFADRLSIDSLPSFGVLEQADVQFAGTVAVRPGGMRRILLRAYLEELNQPEGLRVFAIERLQMFMGSPDFLTLSASESGKNKLLYLIWSLDNVLLHIVADDIQDALFSIVATLFKHVLRTHRLDMLLESNEAAGIMGECGEAILSDAPVEKLMILLRSANWRRLIDDVVAPVAFSIMDREYIDHGANAMDVAAEQEEGAHRLYQALQRLEERIGAASSRIQAN